MMARRMGGVPGKEEAIRDPGVAGAELQLLVDDGQGGGYDGVF